MLINAGKTTQNADDQQKAMGFIEMLTPVNTDTTTQIIYDKLQCQCDANQRR
jgi:hypothetical protein